MSTKHETNTSPTTPEPTTPSMRTRLRVGEQATRNETRNQKPRKTEESTQVMHQVYTNARVVPYTQDETNIEKEKETETETELPSPPGQNK